LFDSNKNISEEEVDDDYDNLIDKKASEHKETSSK
jgi:hypothetical protein